MGTAASAFNIDAQGLPVVTNLPVQLTSSTPTHVSLVFSNRVFSDSRWYSSTNLQTWTENQVGIDLVAPATNTVQVPINAPDKFFRMAQVQYPASTRAPKTVLGRTLVMIFSTGQTNTIVFNNTGGGTYPTFLEPVMESSPATPGCRNHTGAAFGPLITPRWLK